MIYLVLIPIFGVVGFIIWWKFFKKEEVVVVSMPDEIVGDEICQVINLKEKNKNDYFVVGKHYSILLFKNAECIFSSDEYKISIQEILSHIEDETPHKKKQDENDITNKTINIYTCYKVRKNEINGLEFNYNSSTQLMDVYFGVLFKMRFSIRASFRIIDKPLFVRDFAAFNTKLSLAKFQNTLKNLMLSKLYGSMTLYMQKNQVSFLHISLHKYNIENQVLLDLNKYLDIYGIELTKFSFQEITNVEDKYFKWISSIILEASKMNLLDYTYSEKRDFENGIHEDIQIRTEFSEAKVYIK